MTPRRGDEAAASPPPRLAFLGTGVFQGPLKGQQAVCSEPGPLGAPGGLDPHCYHCTEEVGGQDPAWPQSRCHPTFSTPRPQPPAPGSSWNPPPHSEGPGAQSVWLLQNKTVTVPSQALELPKNAEHSPSGPWRPISGQRSWEDGRPARPMVLPATRLRTAWEAPVVLGCGVWDRQRDRNTSPSNCLRQALGGVGVGGAHGRLWAWATELLPPPPPHGARAVGPPPLSPSLGDSGPSRPPCQTPCPDCQEHTARGPPAFISPWARGGRGLCGRVIGGPGREVWGPSALSLCPPPTLAVVSQAVRGSPGVISGRFRGTRGNFSRCRGDVCWAAGPLLDCSPVPSGPSRRTGRWHLEHSPPLLPLGSGGFREFPGRGLGLPQLCFRRETAAAYLPGPVSGRREGGCHLGRGCALSTVSAQPHRRLNSA